jgi:ATP synthase protein I
MAGTKGSDDTGKPARMPQEETPSDDGELERRRLELEATLATRRPAGQEKRDGAGSGGVAGYGQAMKLSSEFIAGIAVGAGLGWVIDRLAGTSPWGLIVFLLLGFGAGVLNVMRAAGVVAEAGIRAPDKGDHRPGKN